ncbi:hypothetical protein LAC1533_0060 [Ligilactobacillus acidipiscis]|nr:hypothetical protein [Ligilactobacillus acidipiscis]SFV39480.1 hypothetical protein LAC1533_0060 [Ligilactobacillus acidipiscis]
MRTDPEYIADYLAEAKPLIKNFVDLPYYTEPLRKLSTKQTIAFIINSFIRATQLKWPTKMETWGEEKIKTAFLLSLPAEMTMDDTLAALVEPVLLNFFYFLEFDQKIVVDSTTLNKAIIKYNGSMLEYNHDPLLWSGQKILELKGRFPSFYAEHVDLSLIALNYQEYQKIAEKHGKNFDEFMGEQLEAYEQILSADYKNTGKLTSSSSRARNAQIKLHKKKGRKKKK